MRIDTARPHTTIPKSRKRLEKAQRQLLASLRPLPPTGSGLLEEFHYFGLQLFALHKAFANRPEHLEMFSIHAGGLHAISHEKDEMLSSRAKDIIEKRRSEDFKVLIKPNAAMLGVTVAITDISSQ